MGNACSTWTTLTTTNTAYLIMMMKRTKRTKRMKMMRNQAKKMTQREEHFPLQRVAVKMRMTALKTQRVNNRNH